MTLAEFTIELRATNELLLRQAVALERLSESASRLCSFLIPDPKLSSNSNPATLSDLSYVSPQSVESRLAAEDEFAHSSQSIPRSEFFYAKIKEFEEQVREAYGDQAVSELPWNKAAE